MFKKLKNRKKKEKATTQKKKKKICHDKNYSVDFTD